MSLQTSRRHASNVFAQMSSRLQHANGHDDGHCLCNHLRRGHPQGLAIRSDVWSQGGQDKPEEVKAVCIHTESDNLQTQLGYSPISCTGRKLSGRLVSVDA